MNKRFFALLVSAITLSASVQAQPGRMGTLSFGGSMTKLFGDNSAFSANIEIQIAAQQQSPVTVPGTIDFDSGKTRLQMNLSDAKDTQLPAIALERLKAMGMDKTIAISRPDKKVSYVIYPGLNAYVESSIEDADAAKPASAFKMQTTELGKETVDGHPCVKNKDVVTDDSGKSHESTVWNATDLNNFPVKIQMEQDGRVLTMSFKNVQTKKPDSSVFDAPAGFKKYDSQQSLMMVAMTKRAGAAGGPPAHP